jgi:transposase
MWSQCRRRLERSERHGTRLERFVGNLNRWDSVLSAVVIHLCWRWIMGKAYSEDLRERVEARIAGGHSRREAARHFDVSVSFAVKLSQRVAQTGSVAASRQGRPPGHGKLAQHLAQLIGWVEAEPDLSLAELALKLQVASGVVAHPASISRALSKAGFSFKKNIAGIRVRTRRHP